jgi:hypothetical protein
MVNYQEGRIYRLVCNVTGLVYIGSTTQPLYKRKYGHTKDYERWKEGKTNYVTSFKIIENGDYDIFLIEDCPCDTREQLMRRERYWIEQTECVNRCIPTRTNKEYREANADRYREQRKLYYQNNIERFKEEHKQYRCANAERIKAYLQQYRQDNTNKVRMSEYSRHYNQANSDRIKALKSEKVLCECGGSSTRNHIRRHEQSKQHTDWVRAQTSTA